MKKTKIKYINVGINLITNNNNQKLRIFLRVRSKQDLRYFYLSFYYFGPYFPAAIFEE